MTASDNSSDVFLMAKSLVDSGALRKA
jgi:hypothetical protein